MVNLNKGILILLFLAIVLVLVVGCTSPKTTPTPTFGPSKTTQVTPQTTVQTGASACHSPYDGTYSGLVSGSGQFSTFSSDMSTVKSPYILTYNLEMTVECRSLPKDNNGYWLLKVTHAKVSDPFFGCTNGCTPINDPDALWSLMQLLPPGEKSKENILSIVFPSGTDLMIRPIIADSDAKTIRADQSNHGYLVANTVLGWSSKCSDSGGIGTNCAIESGIHRGDSGYLRDQEGVTMTLNKIS